MISKVDDLGLDKLKTVPNDLKKLSHIVDKHVLKKSEYNTDKQVLDKKNKMS